MPLFIGLMSGTSMDGIDAAVFDFQRLPPRLVAARTHAIPPPVRQALVELASAQRDTLDRLCQLDVRLGRLFAEAALAVMRESGLAPTEIRAIGSHGQTVRHHPQGDTPYTIQIGDPNIIAEQTGVTTVGDFRRRDMAAGGQGAPLVPAFHEALLREPSSERVVLNIGGIANVTILPGDPGEAARGFDTGPGNTLLDAWVSEHRGQPLDVDGMWAASGRVDSALLEELLRDPYFNAPPPKSTGPERFNLQWLRAVLARLPRSSAPQDVQRTLCELTVAAVAEALRRFAPQTREILVCGGGARNPVLMSSLARRIPQAAVRSTGDHGLDPQWVEAAAFAWLAKRTLDGAPGNLPAVTGARRAVILGGIYRAG